MMYDGWMWGDGWGWAGWVLMCVVMVLFWVAVITAIILAIRYLVGTGGASGGPGRYEPPRPRTCSPDAHSWRDDETNTGGASRSCANMNIADRDG